MDFDLRPYNKYYWWDNNLIDEILDDIVELEENIVISDDILDSKSDSQCYDDNPF